jgi:hypothetical protein
MGGSSKEVRLCNIPECSLFPYRLGKNPARARKGGDRQKKPFFVENSIAERQIS